MIIDHIWTTRRAESRISNPERLPLLGNFRLCITKTICVCRTGSRLRLYRLRRHAAKAGGKSRTCCKNTHADECPESFDRRRLCQFGEGISDWTQFFVPSSAMTADELWLDDIINFEIIPLIEEYWIDDPKKRSHALQIVRG